MEQVLQKNNTTKTITKKNSNFFGKESTSPFFSPVFIQPKLTVNQPNDIYEQEADAVADKVMRMEDTSAASSSVVPAGQSISTIQRQCTACEEEKVQRKENEEEETVQTKPMAGFIQRKCAACQKEENIVQRKVDEEDEQVQMKPVQNNFLQRKCAACQLDENMVQRTEGNEESIIQMRALQNNLVVAGCKEEPEKEFPPQTLKVTSPAIQKKSIVHTQAVPDNVAGSIESSKGKGSMMDKGTISFMAPRFNRDFSDVKIHTGIEAVGMNRQLNARAFTVGRNIYFNEAEYQPQSFHGKKLLAHELTHVIQQTNTSPAKNYVFRKPENDVPAVKGSACDQYEPAPVNASQGVESETETGNLPDTPAVEPKSVTPSPQTAKVISDTVTPKATPSTTAPAGKSTNKDVPKDPAFEELIGDSKKQSKKQQKHSEPPAKTAEAADAVSVAKDEKAINSGATVLTVADNVESQPKQAFNAEKFKEDLRRKITEAIPDNEKDAKAFIANPQKIKDVSDSTKTDIKSAEKNVVSGAEKISEPSVANNAYKSTIPVAPDRSYEPEQVGAKPVIKDPERAVPKPLNEEDMQMDKEHDADSLDKAMSDHKVSDNQLAESEEPKFIETLETKQTSQQELCKIPQQLQDAQNMQQQGDTAAAHKQIQGEMKGMNDTRKDQFGHVQNKQGEVKSEGEMRLQEYYTDIKNIYETTQLNVTNCLAYLECQVSNIFQDAVDKAFETFKTNVHNRLDYYYDWHIFSRDYEKEDRFTRMGNAAVDQKIKSLTKKRDSLPENDPQWTSLNNQINILRGSRVKLIIEKTFDEEKDLFTGSLNSAINEISVIVANGLNRAKALIEKGRKAVLDEHGLLDDENKKKADEATADFQSKFDDLEGKVNDKEADLKDGLVKQYTESVAKLKDTFETIRKEAAMSWWEKAWRKIKEIVMVIIDIGKLLFKIVVKAAGIIGDIIAHPIRFFGNLINAVSSGFKNFIKNIGQHLENIIFKLILGVVPPGIMLPEKWDPKGIFSFVLDFFGLSKQNIRAQAVNKFGELVVAQLEQGFELFVIFKNEGFAGLWEHIQTKIGDLKNMIIEEVKTFFKESIIKAAIEFLLAALTPASGFIKVCKAIIGIVTFFIKNLVNILKLLDSILDSFADMVAGRIGKAAARVESALADILLIGIKFLAALVGINLDKIQGKISKILNAVRNPINRAIQWFLEKAQEFAEKTGLLKVIRAGKAKYEVGKEWAKDKVEAGKEKVKEVAGRIIQWWKVKKGMTFSDGKKHTLYFDGEAENALLMMKSTPQSYKDYIKGIVISAKDAKKKKEQEAAKTGAMIVAGEIDTLIKQNKRTKTENGTKDITPDFKAKLDELAGFTVIFTERDDKQLPVSSAPVYGDMENGFATSMKIEKLTKLGPSGTKVSVANPTMDILLNRLETKRSYYIAGHLLNNNLHGSGDTWQNLTPLTQRTNAEHLRTIERALKSAVAKGRVFSYNIDVVYGRKLNTPLIQQIDGSSDKAEVKTMKKQIVTAEQYVPRGITGKVQEVDYDGKPLTERDALVLEHSVVNVVDQSSPLAYKVKNET